MSTSRNVAFTALERTGSGGSCTVYNTAALVVCVSIGPHCVNGPAGEPAYCRFMLFVFELEELRYTEKFVGVKPPAPPLVVTLN